MSESGPSCQSSKELGSAHSALVAGSCEDRADDTVRIAGPDLELPIVRSALWPALAAVRPRLRDAGGALPLQIRAHAGSPERDRGSAAGRRGRRILRTGAL